MSFKIAIKACEVKGKRQRRKVRHYIIIDFSCIVHKNLSFVFLAKIIQEARIDQFIKHIHLYEELAFLFNPMPWFSRGSKALTYSGQLTSLNPINQVFTKLRMLVV